MKIARAYKLKLYPNKAQTAVMARHAGACRWLWNYLLALQKDTHASTGKFVFFHDMSKMLPGLKRDYPWLADAPSNSLVRVCRNLDRALKDCFRRGLGFPRFKKKGLSRESFYVINQAMWIEEGGRKVTLPKLGQVRFRTGRPPVGRVVAGNVSCRAGTWWCTVQCEAEEEVVPVTPQSDTVIGGDLGLNELLVCSDGTRIKAPRHLRAAEHRLKRAQKVLLRRKKGSSNRRKQAVRVARLHAKVADARRDTTHQATAALVKRCSAVVTETPNVKGMMQNRRLAKSFADASWGETLRQIGYKSQWAGKSHLKVGRFEPSTQTCSSCGTRKTGDARLRLHHRTYRCDCGAVIDRDLNAALNLRRIGLEMLGISKQVLIDVGRVTPERAGSIKPSANACGDSSVGRVVHAATRRRGSRKQEVESGTTRYAT